MLTCMLISMPWAAPMRPSIQTGALKAYIDQNMNGKVRTTAISAHLGILYECAGTDFLDFFQFGESKGEALYLLLYQHVFGLPNIPSAPEIREQSIKYIGRKTKTPEIGYLLEQLGDATDRFIEKNIVNCLQTEGTNVVGFSINFNQFYASLYCLAYLKRHYPLNYVFVMGGTTMALPKTLNIMGLPQN